MTNLGGVVRMLKKEQDRLTKDLRGIGAALAAFGAAYGKRTRAGRPKRKRRMSARGRAAIIRAQKKRWAKVRAAKKAVAKG